MNVQEQLQQVLPELRPGLPWPIRLLSRLPMSRRRIGLMRLMDALIYHWVTRDTESRQVPGSAGNPLVPVVVIDRRGDRRRPTPAVLHMHGGGYIMGRPGLQVPMLKRLSAELNCLVVSVDYRLAPQTPFPGSLEDNYAALRWLHDNAAELGVDPERIALVGESAGGGHAAALAIATRDRGQYPLCMQVLIYPMLDDRTASRAGGEWCGHFVWSSNANRVGWRALLGCEPGTNAVPPGAVPARIENLQQLPSTWIGVGDLDLFHGESLAYAQRLKLAGVATELYTQTGAYHGFDLLAGKAPLAKAFTQSWVRALERAFAA